MSQSIVGLTDVKSFLGIDSTDTTYDTVLTSLIQGVSDLVREYCGRTFDYGTYNETLDIDYDFTDRIILAEYPVHSVVALTDYNTAISSDYYVLDSDLGIIKLKRVYKLYERGSIYKYFRKGVAHIQVTYIAGMTPDYDEGLKLAVKTLVAEYYNTRSKIGIQSERIGNYGYTLRVRRKGELFPPQVEALLQPYVDNRV